MYGDFSIVLSPASASDLFYVFGFFYGLSLFVGFSSFFASVLLRFIGWGGDFH